MEFSEKLRKLIELSGLNNADFSRKVGISQATITYYLKGTYAAKDKNILKIASACNVNPDWLRGSSESMYKENAPAADGESIPPERREIVERVKTMSEDEFAKLKSILDLIG